MNGTDLPSCDICVADPEAAVYRIYNSIVIGVLVPAVGLMGIIGNGLSAAVYSRPVSPLMPCWCWFELSMHRRMRLIF